MRIFQTILIIVQLLFITIVDSRAQDESSFFNAKDAYQVILIRFELLAEYYHPAEEENALYREAMIFAENQEYDMAIVYLEEAIALLKEADESTEVQDQNKYPIVLPQINNHHQLNFTLLSGIDFNRQEFETGYIESDSLMIEELNKLYIGVSAGYRFQFSESGYLEAQNAVRVDKENFRDDYRVLWQPDENISLHYNGYWNQSRDENSYSYWEQVLTARLNQAITEFISVTFFNSFDYKMYGRSDLSFEDYYRNRFDSRLELNMGLMGKMQLGYLNEMNELLGGEDNDYLHHALRLGWQNTGFSRFVYQVMVEAAIRDYTLQYDATIIKNRYRALRVDGVYEVAIVSDFRLSMEDNFLRKVYDQKSSLEPDYYWNLLRLIAKISMSSTFSFGFGTEYEFKDHQGLPAEDYNVNEQNYRSRGLYFEINYFALEGAYLSASISYQQRRYPDSATNDLISLYSDRNLLSFMIIGSANLTSNLSIYSFTTFDDDKDIDLDQQDNQSVIFSTELVYRF
ncbi:MAG: hypothetical protein E4H13_00660 [Calditrichales bacterium]|nr:MAG: hypothetical protein E4H13_00660 [Calditrichales bacterium]